MTSSDARLILKADDFGDMSAGNDAINDLVRQGLITNVGIMSGCTSQVHVDELLDAINAAPDPSLVGLALHVNFQTGTPLAGADEVPSLVDSNGKFKRPEPTREAWNGYASQLNPLEVEKELEAQIRQFLRFVGRLPDALDSHNIILSVPPVDEIAMRKAAEYKLALTYPYLYTRTYDGVLASQTLHKELLARYRAMHIPTADHAYPRYFNSYAHPIDATLSALNSLLPGVTQIVFHPVHPGYQEIETDSDGRFQRRLTDYKILTDIQVMSFISELRRERRLTSYKRLRLEKYGADADIMQSSVSAHV